MVAPAESTISASANTSSLYPKSKGLSVTSRPAIVSDFKYQPRLRRIRQPHRSVESREIEPTIVVHGQALRSTTTRWTQIDVHRLGVNRLRTHGQARSALGHEAALERRADRCLDRHRRRVVLADSDVLGAELCARAWTRLGLDLQDVVARRYVREFERALGADRPRLAARAPRCPSGDSRQSTRARPRGLPAALSAVPATRTVDVTVTAKSTPARAPSSIHLHRLRGLDVRRARVVHRCESRRARTARGGLRRIDGRDDQVRTARQPEQPISTSIVCESRPRRELRNRPLAVVLEPERTHQHALKRLASPIDDGPADDAARREHQLDLVNACVAANMQPVSDPGTLLVGSAREGQGESEPGHLEPVVAVWKTPNVEPAVCTRHGRT